MLAALGNCTVLHKQQKIKTAKGTYTTQDVSVPGAAERHSHSEGAVLLGLCFFLALPLHEAIALDWSDYADGMMRISKGDVNGVLDTNKTDDDIQLPVVEQLAAILSRWHKECGSPASRFIISNKQNKNPVNVNSLCRRFIRPCRTEKGLEWRGYVRWKAGRGDSDPRVDRW